MDEESAGPVVAEQGEPEHLAALPHGAVQILQALRCELIHVDSAENVRQLLLKLQAGVVAEPGAH